MARAKNAEPTEVAEPKHPLSPSFGLSEGTRREIEENGEATDPFTGRRLTKNDLK